MYCGVIEGVGPRYCPSIEDKVVRFAEKERHQMFLEPEGRHTLEYYVNGVSTSLPYEVQLEFLRSIVGLGKMRDPPPGLCGGVRLLPAHPAPPDFGNQTGRGPLLRRPDQRHFRLRGSGRAGAHRRSERRPQSSRKARIHPRPRRSLPWRHGGRPRHPWLHRALPHVHQPGRIPSPPPPGQRRSPPHPESRRHRPCQR